MSFIYNKRVHKNGKTYIYPEIRESVRVRGKKHPVSLRLGRVGGSARKAIDEKYREVLRENVYRYGKSKPGERLAREAWAREKYRERLAELNAGAPRPKQEMKDAYERMTQATYDFHGAQERYRMRHAADIREEHYRASHQSVQSRAEGEQFARKQAAEEELAQAKAAAKASQTSQDARKGADTARPNAPEAPGTNDADRAYDARTAARDAAIDEYTAMANAEDAAKDGPADGDKGE